MGALTPICTWATPCRRTAKTVTDSPSKRRLVRKVGRIPSSRNSGINAAREVGQLLRRAVIPEFLEDGIRPTFRTRRLFDGVSVTVFAVRRQGVAHVQIGVSAPILAENFNAIVHAAAARPAVFNQSYGAIGELQDAQRIVFGFGLVAMNVGAHLAVDRLDWRAAEEPIAN